MAYIINKYSGEALLVLQDGTIDTTTSVQLVGRNYVGYGEIQNENFLFLLENFANEAPPARPLAGQTWFDTENNVLHVYDGTRWSPLGTATISLDEPVDPVDGVLWFKEPHNVLYVYNGTDWILIGPDMVEGFGLTRAESTTLIDDNGEANPVIILWVNDKITGIVSSRTFTLGAENPIDGLTEISSGINVPGTQQFRGKLIGVASSASRLENIRTINGVGFNGTADITVKASTTNPLVASTHLLGGSFDGSAQTEFSVDATHINTGNKIVLRDVNGDFAARIITATLAGQVNAPDGTSTFDTIQANNFIGSTLSGTATAALRLSPGKNINDVKFDGTKDITITASAQTLDGEYINNTVLSSNLETVGTLRFLDVQDRGIKIGGASQFELAVKSNTVEMNVLNGPKLSFVNSDTAMSLGGNNSPAIISRIVTDLGLPNYKFNNVHANVFHGEATSARFADLAEYYLSDKEYAPGTVLIFGGEKEVTQTSRFGDHRVAGVVSTDPGFIMNTGLAGTRVCVALQGRVPCNVIGPVQKGDLLITSPISGYAVANNNPLIGTVVGKSLETDAAEGKKVVEVSICKM